MRSAEKFGRRRFLGGSLSGAVGAAAGRLNGEQQPVPQLSNVIVFYSDQQRWDTIGAYGCPMDLACDTAASH